MKIKIKKLIKSKISEAILTYEGGKQDGEELESSVQQLQNLFIFIENKPINDIAVDLFNAEPIGLIEIEFQYPNKSSVIFTK